jgi:hypothetical protein
MEWRRGLSGRGVGLWSEPAEPRVRATGVVVGAPSCEFGTSVRKLSEQRLVEEFVAQPPVSEAPALVREGS